LLILVRSGEGLDKTTSAHYEALKVKISSAFLIKL